MEGASARVMRRRTGEAGFTLLEVMIAAAIITVVIGFAVSSLLLGQQAMNEGLIRSRAQRNVQLVLSTLLPELRQSASNARGSGIVVASNDGGQANKKLTFKKNTGFDGTSIIWSNDIQYQWKNDETVERKETGGTTTTVGAEIDDTFSFALNTVADGDQVTITIASTVQLRDGTTETHSATETVLLRN